MESKKLKKRDYTLVAQNLRQQLIELVEKQKYPIRIAGQLLKIKLSTAKLIVKKYREEKKSKKKATKLRISPQKVKIEENNPFFEIPLPTIKQQNKEQIKAEEVKEHAIFPLANLCYGMNPFFWPIGIFSNN